MPSSPSAAQTAAFARVSRRAATRVRAGHPWIYRSDLADERPLPRGEVVQVQDERGKALGWALSSSSSQIALRMIADSRAEQIQLASLIAERIRQAVDYRERLGIPEMSNAYRVVFSEADRLPGLIVDRYDGVLAFQVLTQSMDREDVRAAILDTLQERLKPAGIVERVESRIRELEELPPISGGLVRGKKAEAVMEMKTAVGAPALRFIYDGASGQKTGAFLDQRENYAAAARYARGAALDVFCYQGGFALHLARSCPQVSGVDSSRPALEAAERNFDLNRDILAASEIEWMEANAFDLLRDWSDAGRKFGSIVLDPPAFAKTKRSLPTALRGYKELNLRALKMLEPGGILITCSCSHHVSQVEFLEMLGEAARDAHRRIRLLEVRGQSQDHPVVAGIPETAYLKCVIAWAE
ncbi:MAG: class I SAM-dependent rRNA methyltransferase [Acidobacteria bacterium]|nr:class I SAM-dependent rRNA methyltransferase [Acidobacteriota bacterium]MBV9145264.1 class I SAM-dependent rRNA methyltransferase [Acidobacteriota bacterium]